MDELAGGGAAPTAGLAAAGFAIGAVAEAALQRALKGHTAALAIVRIPHPSPASPVANRGWANQVDAALAAAGVELGARTGL